MAYEKQTWNTGDVITAEKLNHIEDGVSSASGYTTTTQTAVICDETATFEATQDNSEIGSWEFGNIPSDFTSLLVTFDGNQYEFTNDGSMFYGGIPNMETGDIDFSEYPFAIGTGVIAASAGTHQVKIIAETEISTPSNSFMRAVRNTSGKIFFTVFTYGDNSDDIICKNTYAELVAVAAAGCDIYVNSLIDDTLIQLYGPHPTFHTDHICCQYIGSTVKIQHESFEMNQDNTVELYSNVLHTIDLSNG